MCDLQWKKDVHSLCWETRGWSKTNTAEPPAAPEDKIMKKWENTAEQSRSAASSSPCWYLRRCSSLAALYWQQRWQQLKQVPLSEVVTADKDTEEQLEMNNEVPHCLLHECAAQAWQKCYQVSLLKSSKFLHRSQNFSSFFSISSETVTLECTISENDTVVFTPYKVFNVLIFMHFKKPFFLLSRWVKD